MCFTQRFPPRTATRSWTISQHVFRQRLCPQPALETMLRFTVSRFLILAFYASESLVPAFDHHHHTTAVGVGSWLSLACLSGVRAVASWQDVLALCQVAGEQVLFDAPLTFIATVFAGSCRV